MHAAAAAAHIHYRNEDAVAQIPFLVRIVNRGISSPISFVKTMDRRTLNEGGEDPFYKFRDKLSTTSTDPQKNGDEWRGGVEVLMICLVVPGPVRCRQNYKRCAL